MVKKIFCAVMILGIITVIPQIKTFGQEQNVQKELRLTLDQCIEATLKNNVSRTASSYELKAAEAQLRQAKSGAYPKIDFTASYSLMDQNPNFIFPEMSIQIPPINLGTFSIVPGAMSIPLQNVELADKQTVAASVEVLYPLFTGGKLSSYISQAEAALEIAKSNSRSNDLQIIFETKKLYYATLLTTKLEEIANEAYERFYSTLKLTEATYKNGSGRVTKSDYLKNKTITEAVKAIWIQVTGEKKNALAALAHAMGLDWKTELTIAETEFPAFKDSDDLETLINRAIAQNPLFAKVENGLKVFESKIDLAKSDLYPSAALFGSYKKLFNSIDYGMMTKDNKNVWMIGLGIQLNIFNGFRTEGMIDEARANYNQLEIQKEILTKGISLKVQYLYNKLQTAKDRETAAKEAVNSSAEDRDLVEKAYFSDIMELKDLIQAQITESMMKAQHETILFELSQLEAEMQLVLSNER